MSRAEFDDQWMRVRANGVHHHPEDGPTRLRVNGTEGMLVGARKVPGPDGTPHKAFDLVTMSGRTTITVPHRAWLDLPRSQPRKTAQDRVGFAVNPPRPKPKRR